MPGCRRKARRRCTRGSGRCRARARASGLVPRSFAYTRTRSRATGLDRRLYSWYMRRGIATDAAISVSARGVDVTSHAERHRHTPDPSCTRAPQPERREGPRCQVRESALSQRRRQRALSHRCRLQGRWPNLPA